MSMRDIDRRLTRLEDNPGDGRCAHCPLRGIQLVEYPNHPEPDPVCPVCGWTQGDGEISVVVIMPSDLPEEERQRWEAECP
jgi:hypothetical protein